MTERALMDTAAIAEALRVTRAHVTDRLTKRPDFPRPVVNASQRLRLWDAESVLAWAASAAPARQKPETYKRLSAHKRRAISSAVSR